MNYAELIHGLEQAGHDTSHVKRPDVVTKAVPVAPAPLQSTVIALPLDDIAACLDKAIDDEIEPLIARVDALEAKVAALESELQKFVPSKPRAVG